MENLKLTPVLSGSVLWADGRGGDLDLNKYKTLW